MIEKAVKLDHTSTRDSDRTSLAEIFADTYLDEHAVPAIKVVRYDSNQNEMSAETIPLSTYGVTR